MLATKVEYTIKEEFVEQNKANIVAVMAELKGLGNCGVQYASSVKEDGKSFVHVVYVSEASKLDLLPSLESFKKFQAELKENIEVPPQIERMTVAGASFDL